MTKNYDLKTLQMILANLETGRKQATYIEEVIGYDEAIQRKKTSILPVRRPSTKMDTLARTLLASV